MATPLTADRLLAALRAEGLNVREHTGWRDHERDTATGKTFGPVNGVTIHHTAGRDSLALCWSGRADLPGPLCHTHLAKSGLATMLSAGRANHAGTFAQNAHDAVVAEAPIHPRPDSAEPVDGNDHYYGLEIENLGDGDDPYPAVQYDAAVRWAAAICRAHGWSENSVIGHKEGTRRKVDPSFPMAAFRDAVAARLAHSPGWNPNEEDDMALTDADIKKIFATDGTVPAARPPVANDDYTTGNTSWGAGYALQTITEGVRKAQQQIGAVASDVTAIKAKVDALSVGGVDLDALADKVADKLAARLAE